MKMNPAKYDEIKDGVRKIVEFHGKDAIQDGFKGKTVTFMMWGLFQHLWHDLQFTDDHPAYKAGRVRISPQTDAGWLNGLYNSGLNDNHIETALKQIARDLDLRPSP